MTCPVAVPYLRVSTSEQAETMSLATQLAVIERWAAAEDFALAPPFTDAGESARSADRTELQRLQLATEDPALAAQLREAQADLTSLTRARQVSIDTQLDTNLEMVQAEGGIRVALARA